MNKSEPYFEYAYYGSKNLFSATRYHGGFRNGITTEYYDRRKPIVFSHIMYENAEPQWEVNYRTDGSVQQYKNYGEKVILNLCSHGNVLSVCTPDFEAEYSLCGNLLHYFNYTSNEHTNEIAHGESLMFIPQLKKLVSTVYIHGLETKEIDLNDASGEERMLAAIVDDVKLVDDSYRHIDTASFDIEYPVNIDADKGTFTWEKVK